jgi:hypothetical protein
VHSTQSRVHAVHLTHRFSDELACDSDAYETLRLFFMRSCAPTCRWSSFTAILSPSEAHEHDMPPTSHSASDREREAQGHT